MEGAFHYDLIRLLIREFINRKMIVKILEKGTPLECDNEKGICVLLTYTPIILEHIKQYLEGLIDGEQVDSCFGFCCTDHINTLWIILEQCGKFRFPLHLSLIDFEKTFDSSEGVDLECFTLRVIPEKVIVIIRATSDGVK